MLYKTGITEPFWINHRLILLLLVFGGSITSGLYSQVEIVPLNFNPQVNKAYINDMQQAAGTSSLRLTGQTVRIDMVIEDEMVLCLDDFLLGTPPVMTVLDLMCSEPEFATFAIVDSCVQINSLSPNSIEEEVFCVEICNEEEDCNEVTILVTIRPPFRLPFLDNFSYDGPFPDIELWIDRNVFINQTMAKDPPSIGVATFDGLDETGSPHGSLDERDVSDVMTSTFIDLSSFNINDDVFLSFYLQKKGLALPPFREDVFRVEFFNNEGEWDLISEFEGIPGSFFPVTESPDFDYVSIRVTNAYMHRKFQFRLSNVSSRSGIREVWHVDYVRLDFNRQMGPEFDDIAFTSPPSSLIFPYTAMPATQFTPHAKSYIKPDLNIGLFSHFPQPQLADPSWHLIRDDYSDEAVLSVGDLTLLELPPLVPENQRDLVPGRHQFNNPLRSDAWIDDLAGLAFGKDSMRLVTTYTFNQDQENINGIPQTIANNTVSTVNEIKNYFAYDDGTAEVGIRLISNPSIRTQMAVKFHLEEPDTLQAVRVHFPYVNGDQSNVLFNLKVWRDSLKEEEDFRMVFLRPIYTDQVFDSLQGFTTYLLVDEQTADTVSIPLDVGDFYIGMQQVSVNASVPMGFDRNNPQGSDFMWLDRGMGWEKYSELPGAVSGAWMFRPVMGNDPLPLTVSAEEPIANSNLEIYPNPTSDFIHFKGLEKYKSQNLSVRVYNTAGQMVLYASARDHINLARFGSGLYSVVVLGDADQHISTHKVLVKQ